MPLLITLTPLPSRQVMDAGLPGEVLSELRRWGEEAFCRLLRARLLADPPGLGQKQEQGQQGSSQAARTLAEGGRTLMLLADSAEASGCTSAEVSAVVTTARVVAGVRLSVATEDWPRLKEVWHLAALGSWHALLLSPGAYLFACWWVVGGAHPQHAPMCCSHVGSPADAQRPAGERAALCAS